MTTEIREFYIKRVPVDVQERLTARDEAQVMLVMDSFAAHRTESDRAKIKALVDALTESNVCETCEGAKELQCPCLSCGDDCESSTCCNHSPETIECPCCDGRGTRSEKADAAIKLAGGE